MADDLFRILPGRFIVKTDIGGTQLGKTFHILLRVHYHQVHVQRFPGHPGHGFHHRKSEGNVGHENAVHDVQMDNVGILVEHFHIFFQMQEIGR